MNCKWETKDGFKWVVGCSEGDKYEYNVNLEMLRESSKYFHFLYCPFCGKKIEQIEVEK